MPSNNQKNVERHVQCKACHGGGKILCFACEGRGIFTTVTYGFTTSSKPCVACQGSGIKQICSVCEGKGYNLESA